VNVLSLLVMVTTAKLMTMSPNPKEKQIPAGEFKAKCLGLLDEVEARGRSFVVTKRGRPVARVVPLGSKRKLLGSVLHEEDLLTPVDVVWDAER